jgi:hypothetical protein
MLTVRVRRLMTLMMSRMAAPVGEVTTPTRRGKSGSGRFNSSANKPSAASLSRICSNATRNAPAPTGSSPSTSNSYSPRGS